MKCYICNADSDTIAYENGEYGPCADCQAEIYECLMGYPSIEVDEDTCIIDEEALYG